MPNARVMFSMGLLLGKSLENVAVQNLARLDCILGSVNRDSSTKPAKFFQQLCNALLGAL